MSGHEPDDLTADLQLRHVPVQVDPIQALHIQHHMPVQQVSDFRLCGHTRSVDRTRHTKPAPP
jgi:hypothetical protein